MTKIPLYIEIDKKDAFACGQHCPFKDCAMCWLFGGLLHEVEPWAGGEVKRQRHPQCFHFGHGEE